MSEKSSTFAIEKEVENQQVRCSTWNKKSKKKRNKNGRANREKQAQSTMKHSIEINQNDSGIVYIKIYEVIYNEENGNERIWQRYMSEERAEEVCKYLQEFEEEKYHTAYWISRNVFL